MKIPKLTVRHYALRAFVGHAMRNDQDLMFIDFVMPDHCSDEDRHEVQKEMERMGREFEKQAKAIKPY